MRLTLLSIIASLLAMSPMAWAQKIEGTTLRVATWGGSWRQNLEATVGKKLESMGVKVQYFTGTPAENLAKVFAARGRDLPFDVMENSPELIQILIREGLVEKINLARIPNASQLPTFAVSQHYIITSIAQDGILYNEQKFKELGIPKPEKYSDLMNPKLEGRVAFPDVTVSPHWNAVVGLAYEAGGTERTMDKAIEQVRRIKPLYYFPSSTEVVTKFNLGDVWAAPSHAGWYVRMKRTGFPIAFSHAKVAGKLGALESVYVHIMKGTKHLTAAEEFINAYLAPDVQFSVAKLSGVGPINSAARKQLMSDPEAGGVLLLSDEQVASAFLIDWTVLEPDAWREMWTRSIKR